MTSKLISDQLNKIFGLSLYQKSLKFLSNKINIIYSRESPIKIRSLILDNEREFHLIIDEKNKEIFHDCPSFWIHSDRDKKICVHLLKLISIIKNETATSILDNFDDYHLTSKDLNSKKRSKNFLLLANSCFDNNNCVEALSYLDKAIFNEFESEAIIELFLSTAISNSLYFELFEFLKNGYESGLEVHFLKFNSYIEKGIKDFLNCIQEYSFFDLLKIIESIDKIFEFKEVTFLASLFNELKKLVKDPDINNKFFAIYLIQKNKKILSKLNNNFNLLFSDEELESFKEDLVEYFISEIDNFCIIDKLKLMKKQFHILNIPEEKFYNDYGNYKIEIQELEKKVYLKKFAFLKVLIERYNLKKTTGDFKKKKNTYTVKHHEENLRNPAYNYIISRIGFFGLNDQTIKSSEIGINYFIMKELFLDDLSKLQDAFYYRKQFWGEEAEYKIKSVDGLSLVSRNIEYSYDVDQASLEDIMIIEWDLANKPIQGSIVNAYGSQIIIPDQNNPIFHDLKPFDLCYCKKTPVKIESYIIKTVNVIKKCSFKDAIKSVSRGMTFIEGYYPLSLIKAVLYKEINPFQANQIVSNNPNKFFIPNYSTFIEDFKEFLFGFILNEKEYVFEELKLNIKENTNLILNLLNLNDKLAGLDLPFDKILKKLIYPKITLKKLKSLFLVELHSIIEEILGKGELGSTIIFDLKKMKNTAFFKYANLINDLRRNEFMNTKISRLGNKNTLTYDLSEINKTYFGKKFARILNIQGKSTLKPEMFKKFRDFCHKLNLKIKFVDSLD